MLRRVCAFLLLGVLAVLQLAAGRAQARDLQLPPAILRSLSSHETPPGGLSVYAQDLQTEEVLLSYNADLLRQPASTIKVLTTFVALDMLGPAYAWKTEAYVDGTLKNGVLNGDLIIVGGGDPYMTAERWWSFVNQLRQTGLKVINGDLIFDRSFFEPLDENRAAFDGQAEKSYNVVPDALMVNFQTSRFTLTGGADGNRAIVTVDPLPANLKLNNEVKLSGSNCKRGYQGLRFATPEGETGNVLSLQGLAPSGCPRLTLTRAIMSAPEYAYGTFRTYWEELGGSLSGKLRLGAKPAAARLMLSYDSLTLGEIVRLVNKYSNNVMARTLLLTLGAEKFGPPATLDKGRRAINEWLAEHQIDSRGFALDNGSGLSRVERTTAVGLGALLRVAWHSQFMPEFAASLPLSATDGTLRERFQSYGMRGRIRMKTGHLDDVSSLAGYVNAASGKSYVVVIFVNHPGAQFGAGDEVQADILRWVFGQ